MESRLDARRPPVPLQVRLLSPAPGRRADLRHAERPPSVRVRARALPGPGGLVLPPLLPLLLFLPPLLFPPLPLPGPGLVLRAGAAAVGGGGGLQEPLQLLDPVGRRSGLSGTELIHSFRCSVSSEGGVTDGLLLSTALSYLCTFPLSRSPGSGL